MIFLKALFARIGDLFIKNLSIKVEVAIIITYVYLHDSAILGLAGFVLTVVTWLAVVGFRYLEKVKNISKDILDKK